MGLNPTGNVAFMKKAFAVRMFKNAIPLDARLDFPPSRIRSSETGTHRSGRLRYGVDTP